MLKTKNVQGVTNKRFLLNRLIEELFQNKIYLLVLTAIFIKSILFVGLLGTEKATGINIYRGFFSVPPYLIMLNFVIVILSFSFLFKGRTHLWAMIIINILATILFIGDAWYYRGFTGFLNFFLFSQTSNLDNLGNSVLSMYRPIDLIFIIDILILIIFTCKNRKFYIGVKRNLSLFLLTLILPTLYLTYTHFKVDVFKRCFPGQYAFRQSWSPSQTMSDLGPLGYHIFDAYVYYENSKSYVLNKDEEKQITNWYDKNLETLPDNQYAKMFKDKNLIVIQWESLENFVVNQKIQGQEITPILNKLLNNSLYFNNYHENVNNGTSSDADLLTNTGVYPVREGATFFRYPNNTYSASLPNLLKDVGYSTFALHPDSALYWNWKPALQSIGFQKCYDSTSYVSKNPIGLGIADSEFLPQVASIIETAKQPFYSFAVTLTSHSPFDLPKQYREMKLDDAFDQSIMGDYFQSMHYTDKYIGTFIDELDKKGILKNSIVVIYGDHTGIHKFYPDKADAVKPAEDWWMHNDMRIPLVIYNSSLKGQIITTEGGQIDLLPTLAYLLGIDKNKYENQALGKNLLNTNKNYTILQNLKMYGTYSPEEEKHATNGIILSNIMVQNNYFRNK